MLGGGRAAARPVNAGVVTRANSRLAEGKRVVLAVEPDEVELLLANRG